MSERRTFMDRALAGEIQDLRAALDDEVNAWHESPETETSALHEWLGLSSDEYARYVERPYRLAGIVESRRRNQPLYIALAGEVSRLTRRGMEMLSARPKTVEQSWPMIASFHKAAHMEVQALSMLAEPYLSSELDARAEAVRLFLYARDPHNAMSQWKQMRIINNDRNPGDRFPELRVRYDAQTQEYFREAGKLSASSTPVADSPLANMRLTTLRHVLDRFPGVSALWHIRHLLALRNLDMREARRALARARELDPDNIEYAASQLLFSSRFDPMADAIELCDKELSRFQNSGNMNIVYSIAILYSYRGKISRSALNKAYRAAVRAKELGVVNYTQLTPDYMINLIQDILRQDTLHTQQAHLADDMPSYEVPENLGLATPPAWMIDDIAKNSLNRLSA